MGRTDATSDDAARCLMLLEQAAKPMTAAELATRMSLAGSRETQRRHVRAIIKRLRDTGAHIVATLQGGYCLTEDDDVWRDYQEGRKIDAKRVIGEAHRRQRQIGGDGQMLMFAPVGSGYGVPD